VLSKSFYFIVARLTFLFRVPSKFCRVSGFFGGLAFRTLKQFRVSIIIDHTTESEVGGARFEGTASKLAAVRYRFEESVYKKSH
jgi:hypothetical protein